MTESATKRTCKAQTKAGERCRARAISADGLCAAHSGKVDMRAIGQAGGRARTRSMLGLDVDADVNLREKARKRLEAQLDSDDERLAQAAARALYSYGPAKPPADAEQEALRHPEGLPHRGVTIARILEIAVFEAQGAIDDELADVVLRSAAKVRELKAARKLAPTFVDQLEEEQVGQACSAASWRDRNRDEINGARREAYGSAKPHNYPANRASPAKAA